MKMQLLLILLVIFSLVSCSRQGDERPPNIVIVFLDDSGWSDFEPFGEKFLETPNVRQLAGEGCSYLNFYVPQAICSASRAALLSGCYPGRTRVVGAIRPDERGLETNFATLGEVFAAAGYATAVFGKWHIGDQPDTRPPARGFGESCGLMYSNDMWKYHPERAEYWSKHPLRFWENGQVKIEEVTKEDQKHLTKWYTEHAVDFIQRNKDKPFLLYVPHSMPHVPLFCSGEFEGKSGKGLYADVILEVDWSIGQINDALKECGLENNTLLMLTSDNGPWISYGNHAGFTPFREAKATSFDGGVRSACIIKFPGRLPAKTYSNATFCSIDILPTLCHITGVPLPENEIDGENVWDLIRGMQGAGNPHTYYAFSTQERLEGIMSGDGRWKLHLPHPYRTLLEAGSDGMAGKYRQAEIDTSLYDMGTDSLEAINVIGDHPRVAAELLRFAEQHRTRFYAR